MLSLDLDYTLTSDGFGVSNGCIAEIYLQTDSITKRLGSYVNDLDDYTSIITVEFGDETALRYVRQAQLTSENFKGGIILNNFDEIFSDIDIVEMKDLTSLVNIQDDFVAKNYYPKILDMLRGKNEVSKGYYEGMLYMIGALLNGDFNIQHSELLLVSTNDLPLIDKEFYDGFSVGVADSDYQCYLLHKLE